MGKEGCKIDGFIARLGWDVAACKLETFNWADYQILLCINTLTNDKDKARLTEKLTKIYNTHVASGTTMTLATVGAEVKQFWRDRKETRDLIYSGPNKTCGNSNASGQGQSNTEKNKSRRQRKKDKKKAGSSETVSQVTTDADKKKEEYCFKCGETTHRVKECPKQGNLKCKIHPNSNSPTELACCYYRKANNLPVSLRPHPD